MIWKLKHPKMTMEMLGDLPAWLDERNPLSARTQLYHQYGRWEPLPGFRIEPSGLCYPGDPPMELLAETKLRDEVIRIYDCSWVAVIQPDGSFEVSRMS